MHVKKDIGFKADVLLFSLKWVMNARYQFRLLLSPAHQAYRGLQEALLPNCDPSFSVCKVTSGRNRNSTERYIDAEDVDGFLVYTHALVRFCFVPCLKLDNKVYLRRIFYRSHTEKSASINNTDSAKLDKMSYVIWCRTDESLF